MIRLVLSNGSWATFDNFIDLFDFVLARMLLDGEV